MIPNVWHPSSYCMRQSWRIKIRAIFLKQPVEQLGSTGYNHVFHWFYPTASSTPVSPCLNTGSIRTNTIFSKRDTAVVPKTSYISEKNTSALYLVNVECYLWFKVLLLVKHDTSTQLDQASRTQVHIIIGCTIVSRSAYTWSQQQHRDHYCKNNNTNATANAKKQSTGNMHISRIPQWYRRYHPHLTSFAVRAISVSYNIKCAYSYSSLDY